MSNRKHEHSKATRTSVAVLIVLMVITGVGVIVARYLLNTSHEPNVKPTNAYCADGKCYRDNGLYIGPDPLVDGLGSATAPTPDPYRFPETKAPIKH